MDSVSTWQGRESNIAILSVVLARVNARLEKLPRLTCSCFASSLQRYREYWIHVRLSQSNPRQHRT